MLKANKDIISFYHSYKFRIYMKKINSIRHIQKMFRGHRARKVVKHLKLLKIRHFVKTKYEPLISYFKELIYYNATYKFEKGMISFQKIFKKYYVYKVYLYLYLEI